MKRVEALVALAFFIAAPSFGQPANATVGQLLAALKAQPANDRWIVIPIAGSGPGQNGSAFHSDIAIAAMDNYEDLHVAIAWLPVGRDASADPVRYMTVPSAFDYGAVVYPEGVFPTGFGALVIAAVDSSGTLKSKGTSIRAEVRIWSTAECAGETSLAYRSTRWLDVDRGTAIGLTVGNGFRANAGIVNADSVPHTWRVRSTSLGTGSLSDFEVTVGAASSKIVGIPTVLTGPISVTIEADAADFPWTGWGASVDNRSGDGWYSSLNPD